MKWKLVPEEPTDSMLRAGFDSAKDGTYFTHGSIYEAMLAAAPKPEHVATVADVYESRYTLEWNGTALPEGTLLYAVPNV